MLRYFQFFILIFVLSKINSYCER
ncbi:hypothetical protein F383_37839 [Gossypium arboreum]|uniref:Uncharacterized protein n=1 Tax=Gossypium arboreum TaxID=29729 RepID=A0A0B0M951_GOSAR|nr:hypothetical protein F383_37839 [Gossypium arboreum]